MTVIPASEIVTYLAAQVSGLVASTNLFYSRLPDQPDACVAVFSTGGAAPLVTQIGQSQADIKVGQPSFQVRVRDPVYANGFARAVNCLAALQKVVEQTIVGSGSTWHSILALQSAPTDLGRDVKQRHEWSINFLARIEDPNR